MINHKFDSSSKARGKGRDKRKREERGGKRRKGEKRRGKKGNGRERETANSFLCR